MSSSTATRTTRSSKAIFVPTSGPPELRTVNIDYQPSFGQVLVQVAYSGINPADLKHRSLGVSNTIVGYDFSGTVIETTPGAPFRIGDSIFGTTPTGVSRPPAYGTHQDIILAQSDMALKIPPNLPMDHAAGLCVPLRTAILGCYNSLGLPLPWYSEEAKAHALKGRDAILIWGASSTVGIAAVQLAKASGVKHIWVTAREARHDMLQELGATRCFDYTHANIEEEIKSAALESSIKLAFAFDAVGIASNDEHTADICARILGIDTAQQDDNSLIVTTQAGMKTSGVKILHATPDWTVDWNIPDRGLTRIPAQPMEAEKMLEIYEWVIEVYGKSFYLPKVRSVGWEASIEEMVKSLEGKTAAEKVVIKH
jgi:NADPH:quinone reductase-like Zn-dependent oxidoreductase